jgi:hypothetical protein
MGALSTLQRINDGFWNCFKWNRREILENNITLPDIRSDRIIVCLELIRYKLKSIQKLVWTRPDEGNI